MFFEKYHGLGNDFIITNYTEVSNLNCSLLAKEVCNRNTGIGADGFIIIKESPKLEMIYYNADGSLASMCGNGIRCFANYVYNNIHKDLSYEVLTGAGVLTVTVNSANPFVTSINMGIPIFDGHMIPIEEKYETFIDMPLAINNETYFVTALFMATTHAVVFVNNLDEVDVKSLGEFISNNQLFPNKTNVNFVEVIDRKTIKMMTYERGCGITLACGSGACSAAVVAKKLDLCDSIICVLLPLGQLDVSVLDNVVLSGVSEKVFKGEYTNEEI